MSRGDRISRRRNLRSTAVIKFRPSPYALMARSRGGPKTCRERMKLGPKHNRTGLKWPNQDREPALNKALNCRRLCNLLQHE
jgi:hypothetical protein